MRQAEGRVEGKEEERARAEEGGEPAERGTRKGWGRPFKKKIKIANKEEDKEKFRKD